MKGIFSKITAIALSGIMLSSIPLTASATETDVLTTEYIQETMISDTTESIETTTETEILSADEVVAEYILGDVSMDGVINSSDASMVISEYSMVSAGLPSSFSEIQILSADVNKDTLINSSDASLILSYYVHISMAGSLTPDEFFAQEIQNPPQTGIVTTTSATVTTTQTETTTVSVSSTESTTTSESITTTETTTTVITTSTKTTTTTVTTTLDAVQSFVAGIYTEMLYRDYDESGLNYWANKVYSEGKPIQELVSNIMDSSEFKTKNASDENYVTALYGGLLGRNPDTSGLNHWVDQLKKGRSRFSVYLGFVKSAEFKSRCEKLGLSSYLFDLDILSSTVKTNSRYNIYTSADFASSVLGTAYSGQILNITGMKGKWLRVDFHNQTGYIYYDRVSRYEGSGIKVLPVMNIPQNSYIGGEPLPTGCEVTSLSVLMNYLGFSNATKNNLAYNYMPRGDIGYTDPNYAFIGTPSSSSSYGAYANVMVQTANNYFNAIGETNYNVQNISGSSLSSLLTQVNNGNPVLVWHTMNCTYTRSYGATWYFTRGMQYTEPGSGTYSFTWKRNEHCSVLVGYNANENTVILADVWANSGASTGGLTEYSLEQFESGFNWLGNQAVIITK